MLPTILLVFPLVLIYVGLLLMNKNTTPKDEQFSCDDTCSYCDVSRSIHT